MNPKKSAFDVEDSSDDCGESCLFVAPNSTKPLLSVGMTMSFFGILTTPRLWSSRTSTIPFFFLKIIELLDSASI